jgi:probable DNA metabolism protein
VTFAEWRERARQLLDARIPPSETTWDDGASLFGPAEIASSRPASEVRSVPKRFLDMAEIVACHNDPGRWALLYRMLWRLTIGGERKLLHIDVDNDVRQLNLMQKAVQRDMHKMKAFVRFRRVEGCDPEEFVAWHRPDHDIVEALAPWFVARFGSMRWSILTPVRSAHWDGAALAFGPGAPRSTAPDVDALEELWRNYYASIFNPARVNVRAMKAEMPVRHWATLPEAQIISSLLANAGTRVEDMEKKQKPSAAPWVPETSNLRELSEAAKRCEGCDLFRNATQTVFGEGARNARVVLVGEQPGDEEDQKGHPFIGPAGRLLNKALEEAGVDRSELYVTNAVKHFKFEPRGKRRMHKKPTGAEVSACRPWLEAEMRALKPDLIVCLGGTAARSLMGREVRVTVERGEFLPHHWAAAALVTVHPSALLRIPEKDRKEAEWELLVRDLRMIGRWLEEHPKA